MTLLLNWISENDKTEHMARFKNANTDLADSLKNIKMQIFSNFYSPVFKLRWSEPDWLMWAPMWESDAVGSFKLQPSFLSEPGIVLISLVKQKQYIGRSWWQWKTAPLWGNTCYVTSITVIDIKQTNTVCWKKPAHKNTVLIFFWSSAFCAGDVHPGCFV